MPGGEGTGSGVRKYTYHMYKLNSEKEREEVRIEKALYYFRVSKPSSIL